MENDHSERLVIKGVPAYDNTTSHNGYEESVSLAYKEDLLALKEGREDGWHCRRVKGQLIRFCNVWQRFALVIAPTSVCCDRPELDACLENNPFNDDEMSPVNSGPFILTDDGDPRMRMLVRLRI